MSVNPEVDKPLTLGYKSAIIMSKIAVKETFGEDDPLTLELAAIVGQLDWHEDTREYQGPKKDKILRALYECAIAPDNYPSHLGQDEGWKKAQAAMILGDHFASLMEPTFTAEKIAAGLIEHTPGVVDEVTASMPVPIFALT